MLTDPDFLDLSAGLLNAAEAVAVVQERLYPSSYKVRNLLGRDSSLVRYGDHGNSRGRQGSQDPEEQETHAGRR